MTSAADTVASLRATVSALRKERNAMHLRAVVAEAQSAHMQSVATRARARVAEAIDNMRHAEECAALEAGRVAREAAEARLRARLDALPVSSEPWGDAL